MPFNYGEAHAADDVLARDLQAGFNSARVLAARFPLMKDKSARLRVSRVMRRLVRATGKPITPWRVVLLDDTQVINAGVTRGKFVFVWSGLLEFVQSDDELAAVLAHEMGHLLSVRRDIAVAGYVLNDVVMKTALLSQSLRKFAQRETRTQEESVRNVIAYIISYTLARSALEVKRILAESIEQQKEIDADRIAFFLMAKAGYEPRDAIRLIRRHGRIREESRRRFVRSHPTDEIRVRYLENLMVNHGFSSPKTS